MLIAWLEEYIIKLRHLSLIGAVYTTTMQSDGRTLEDISNQRVASLLK